MGKKIKPVNELSTFKIGQTIWFIKFDDKRADLMHDYVGLDDMVICHNWEFDNPNDLHPKDQFIINKKPGWPKHEKLPRMPSTAFYMLSYILLFDLSVYESTIRKINRSNNTGEFYYKCKTTWLPEYAVFETKEAAHLELDRLKKLVRKRME